MLAHSLRVRFSYTVVLKWVLSSILFIEVAPFCFLLREFPDTGEVLISAESNACSLCFSFSSFLRRSLSCSSINFSFSSSVGLGLGLVPYVYD